MKFLFCVPRYHTNLHFQIKALKERENEVAMIALYQGPSEDYSEIIPEVLGYSPLFNAINKRLNKSGGKLIKNSFELKYGFPKISALWRVLRSTNPDVVVIKNIESIFSLVAFLMGKITFKRVVFLTQIPKFRKKKRSWSVFLSGLLGVRVITPVFGDKRFENKNKNLFYIPFTIDAPDFDKKYFKNGKINILSVGKFQERKDQLILIHAVEKLNSAGNLTLTLVGQNDEDEYKERLIKYVKDKGLLNVVFFFDHRSWQETLALYREFDIFVLPAYQESASYSILEAMAAKLPVISSDDNGTASYIRNGENGYVFERRNIDSLKDALAEFISDKEFIIRAGNLSYKLTQSEHSADFFYQEFMKVISN